MFNRNMLNKAQFNQTEIQLLYQFIGLSALNARLQSETLLNSHHVSLLHTTTTPTTENTFLPPAFNGLSTVSSISPVELLFSFARSGAMFTEILSTLVQTMSYSRNVSNFTEIISSSLSTFNPPAFQGLSALIVAPNSHTVAVFAREGLSPSMALSPVHINTQYNYTCTSILLIAPNFAYIPNFNFSGLATPTSVFSSTILNSLLHLGLTPVNSVMTSIQEFVSAPSIVLIDGLTLVHLVANSLVSFTKSFSGLSTITSHAEFPLTPNFNFNSLNPTTAISVGLPAVGYSKEGLFSVTVINKSLGMFFHVYLSLTAVQTLTSVLKTDMFNYMGSSLIILTAPIQGYFSVQQAGLSVLQNKLNTISRFAPAPILAEATLNAELQAEVNYLVSKIGLSTLLSKTTHEKSFNVDFDKISTVFNLLSIIWSTHLPPGRPMRMLLIPNEKTILTKAETVRGFVLPIENTSTKTKGVQGFSVPVETDFVKKEDA